jgi:Domain of unknown function (DUF4157)
MISKHPKIFASSASLIQQKRSNENIIKQPASLVLNQPKLVVASPNDPLEHEADVVADNVMRMQRPEAINFSSNQNFVDRKCAHCEEEEKKEQLQRKEGSAESMSVAPQIVYDVLNSSPGKSLDTDTRSFMESRFNYDFSGVKIHDSDLAAKSASSINALAYTSGNSIVFNSGQYNTSSDSGKKLLAHELTHVVQQSEGVHSKKVQRTVIDSHVITNATIEERLGLTREEIIDSIREADADAIVLAQAAEDALTTQLANAISGSAVDPDIETALNEELGLSFLNAAQRGLIRQQIQRFRRVRETLQSGYLRYLALGTGRVSLVGCEAGECGENFAFSCPGNRLIVLCQTHWDNLDQAGATVLHEPFHIWFDMARHADNALRRADASCFESFALRIAGRAAPASCVGHTAG